MALKIINLYLHLIFAFNLLHFRHVFAKDYEVESYYIGSKMTVNIRCFGGNEDVHTHNGHETSKRSISNYEPLLKNGSPVEDEGGNSKKKANEVHDSGVKEKGIGDSSEPGTGTNGVLHPSTDSEGDDGYQSKKVVLDSFINATAKTELTLYCDDIDLGSNIFGESVEHLNINSTGKLKLSSSSFDGSPNLKVVKIHSNDLYMSSNCSWMSDSLKVLDLVNLVDDEYTLANCSSSLEKASIHGPTLRLLSICTSSLEELNGSWNKLEGSGIQLLCPGGANNVKKLKLRNNRISSWTSCGWPSLIHLELQKNSISDLNLTACSSNNLMEINLAHNNLEHPPDQYPPNLSILNFSHNKLKKLTPFNPNIKDINLSHNLLDVLGKGTFRKAVHLVSLDLSHNRLTVIYGHDFVDLRSLEYLNLSHNIITHVRHEAFMPLKFIHSIHLNNNKLHQLDSRLLSHLRDQTLEFRVDSNPWRCSCHLLASLTRVSRLHCKPDCSNQRKLTCRERKTSVLAEHILRQCIEAVQEVETMPSVLLLPDKHGSDEDTSEEKTDATTYSYVIPCVVILLLVPFVAFGVRKVYLKRRKIRERCNRCNCFSSQGSAADAANVRWTSAQGIEQDSDSETGF